MSCCRHTVMLFPDPRMRSPTALGSAAFCDELDIALAELENVLKQADAAGLGTDPAVVSGHAVYADRSSFAVYANFLGDACQKDAAEASTAAERIRKLIKDRAGMDIAPLRPDYVARTPEDIPAWVKFGGIALIGTVGIVALAYITGQATTLAKLFKSSKRVSGYRRRRRR